MDWWQSQSRDLQTAFEVWLVEVSETPTNWILSAIKQTNFRYIHCPCKGTFHKTRALNLALAASRGDYVVPYDIDLLPVKETLKRHLFIAEQSHQLLITGYRLMSDCETVTVDQMPSALESGTTAPEDQPTALWKHLIRHEKFGVVPFFNRLRLLGIGGWDENFMGWGGEDQDIIERYLQPDYALCRCPELLYLHLLHPPDSGWAERQFVEQNRAYYYNKRQ
jgi:hypothetical protein